jgi:hypothetical protein
VFTASAEMRFRHGSTSPKVTSLRLTDAGEEVLRAIGDVARAHNEAICFGWILRSALHPLDSCNELRPAANSRRASIRATRICA